MSGATSLPVVSVVTPSLNQGAFVEATLRSVMRQEYPAVEHIVVDGGSRDGTHDILRRYEGRYALRWIASEDSGMYEAVNAGLRMARGEIVAYLNTDDLYFPWTVTTIAEFLRLRPDVGVVYGDVMKVDHNTGTEQLVFAPPYSASYLLRLGSLFQPAVFWRRSVLDAIGGFDERLRYGGDLDFWIRAARSHLLARLDEVLAVERIHPAAKSSASADALAAEERRIRASYERSTPAIAAISRGAERARTWLARRLLSIRFLAASRAAGGAAGPWSRFVEHCHPKVRLVRFVFAQLPMIGSRLAASSVHVPRDCLHLDA
jgi:GT2 family glycosyltransferase